jgi:DNA invertase Pin-like site-specific DNA recombinase
MKLVSYIRVSTKGQEASGLGLEAQQALVERYRESVGGTIVAEYRETESGKNNDRPELAKALAHAKRVRGTLVIAKLDRLARNVHFISGLMESGVDFKAAESPNDDRFILHIKAAMAEEERKKISDRTKAALAALKARGVKLGSARPGARRLAGGANPEASKRAGEVSAANATAAYDEIAPLVCQLRADGVSLQAIADHLTAEGHTTRHGKQWSKVQVMRVLERSQPEGSAQPTHRGHSGIHRSSITPSPGESPMATQDRPYPTIPEEDLPYLAERNVSPADMQALAAIVSPEDRRKAIVLVAAGMEPKAAMALATAPEKPQNGPRRRPNPG